MSRISTSSRSPGSAPSMYTGPVSGCSTSGFGAATTPSEASGPNCPSKASRVSRITSSPTSHRITGGMSGCQRLCPVPGSSASVFVRSIRISCLVFIGPSSVWTRTCLTRRFRQEHARLMIQAYAAAPGRGDERKKRLHTPTSSPSQACRTRPGMFQGTGDDAKNSLAFGCDFHFRFASFGRGAGHCVANNLTQSRPSSSSQTSRVPRSAVDRRQASEPRHCDRGRL